MRCAEKAGETEKRTKGACAFAYKPVNQKSDKKMGSTVAARTEKIGGKEMSAKLWDVREVAEFLGLAVGSVYQMLSAKRLPCIRISARCVRFDPKAIEEWVAQRTEEPEAE
jgi:excisionase family DNA binding protein